MSKQVITVNGRMYIIDDETGQIKKVVIQDGLDIPPDDLNQIIKYLAKHQAKEE